jgi:hypothetical protein
MVLATAAGAHQMPVVSTDTLWVDSIATHSGQTAVLDITCFNADSVNAFDIPLQFSDPAIVIDSVSFVGSRIMGNLFTIVTIDSTLGTCKIGAIYLSQDNTPIGPGRGLLARIFVQIPPDYADNIVTIDSTTIVTPLKFVTIDNQSYTPEFYRGYINNSYAPAVADSVWVESVTVNEDEQFSVAVNAYTTIPLYHISLPLEYASDNVVFDSMTLSGTRADNALVADAIYDNDAKKVQVILGFSDADLMPAGSGPIAVLHFTSQSSGTTSSVTIDTTDNYLIEFYFQLGHLFNYVKVYPAFTPGTISIQLGTDVDEETGLQLPAEFRLEQNAPNPFNPATSIAFALPERSHVRLDVYNILGQRVRILVDDMLLPGYHNVVFDGRDGSGHPLASGVYLYMLKANRFAQSKKMVLLK